MAAAPDLRALFADYFMAHYDAFLTRAALTEQQLGQSDSALFAVGLAYRTLKRHADEHSAFARLQTAHGRDNAWAQLAAGILLEEQRNFAAALERLRASLGAAPAHDAIAHLYIGRSLDELGRLPEAVEANEQALRLVADYVTAHLNRGIYLFKLRSYSDARVSFKRSLKLNRTYKGLNLNCGNCSYYLLNFHNALKYYEREMRLSPEDPRAYCNSAMALVSLGQPQPADAMYARAIAADAQAAMEIFLKRLQQPHKPPADRSALLDRIGQCLLALGRHEQAACHFDQSLALVHSAAVEQRLQQTRVHIAQRRRAVCVLRRAACEALFRPGGVGFVAAREHFYALVFSRPPIR